MDGTQSSFIIDEDALNVPLLLCISDTVCACLCVSGGGGGGGGGSGGVSAVLLGGTPEKSVVVISAAAPVNSY